MKILVTSPWQRWSRWYFRPEKMTRKLREPNSIKYKDLSTIKDELKLEHSTKQNSIWTPSIWIHTQPICLGNSRIVNIIGKENNILTSREKFITQKRPRKIMNRNSEEPETQRTKTEHVTETDVTDFYILYHKTKHNLNTSREKFITIMEQPRKTWTELAKTQRFHKQFNNTHSSKTEKPSTKSRRYHLLYFSTLPGSKIWGRYEKFPNFSKEK